MASNVQYMNPADLPETLPLFPLPGALLLPRGLMPLNIFEPRYVAMIDAALKGERLIGMIQPDPGKAEDMGLPALYGVGCAGRITQFSETGDGRYLIQLTGVARFTLAEELSTITPFRQAKVDFSSFSVDLEANYGEAAVDRASILRALKDFSKSQSIEIDWDNIGTAPNEALVNALSMMAPYGVAEKQALLEAPTLAERGAMLVALTEMELAREGHDGGTKMQ
jgi:uncharacterized protein